MKKSKKSIKKFMILSMTALVILFFNGCNDLTDDELQLDMDTDEQLISWNELLNQVDTESEIAYVQNGESIQEAIDAVSPGDYIYVEPGTYLEDLQLNNSDIKIIGLSLSPNDLVIKNSNENNIEILKLYDQKSLDKFQKKSRDYSKRRRIMDFSRTELGGGIAHYEFKVRMGEGEFDVISIHRVVRERRAYHPVRTKGNVLMVHGAFTGFGGTFLMSGLESKNDINAKTSSPFYLASKDIDVWGIDMGWTMVPNTTTEFTFMKDWGYKKDAKHTLRAMRIIRMARGFTGQGFKGLNLLGFSSGNTVAYAAANAETQKRCRNKRHIKGLISIDNAFKNENGEDSGCVAAQAVADQITSGMFENRNGQFFQTIGYLALYHPDEVSPIFDDGATTNIQVFRLVLGADAFGFGFHFLGGDYNGLLYSDETRALRAVANYSHYMPNLLWQEIDAVNCSSMGVRFDDYLNLISVPILYIGAGGGVGVAGMYTSSLTASTDITNHIVNITAPPLDFGHVDNWLAKDADQLVWSKLLRWIVNH